LFVCFTACDLLDRIFELQSSLCAPHSLPYLVYIALYQRYRYCEMLFTLADIRQLVEQLEQQQQTRVENGGYNNNDNNYNNSRSSSPLALSRSHSSSIPTNQHIMMPPRPSSEYKSSYPNQQLLSVRSEAPTPWNSLIFCT
jgi:hypothetical protein